MNYEIQEQVGTILIHCTMTWEPISIHKGLFSTYIHMMADWNL